MRINKIKKIKNKQGKSKNFIIFLMVAVLIFGIYYFISSSQVKTVTQHMEPADISKSESGTGLIFRFADCGGRDTYDEKYCTMVEIPSWFSSIPMDNTYSIAKSPSPKTCTLTSDCSGYATNPNIMCWEGSCILGHLDVMWLDYSIKNPSSSGVIFNNISVYSASPDLLNNSVNKSVLLELKPGQTVIFKMANAMSVSSFVNKNITFALNASGINSYTHIKSYVGDKYTLGFYNDPVSSTGDSLSIFIYNDTGSLSGNMARAV
jgi:hypothetical protein